MKIPLELSHAFEKEFEDELVRFCIAEKLIEEERELYSPRFLSRSVVPHVRKLSQLFNRLTEEEETPRGNPGLDPYWKKSSHPEHLRLAYFLYFMPCNAFRMAGVWSELFRLGYRFDPEKKNLRAIDFGAGPGSAACGVSTAEKHVPLGLPSQVRWAFIEQDKATLTLGTKWAETLFAWMKRDWTIDPFHRKIRPSGDLLPERAPKFDLWVSSFFLNEHDEPADDIARSLLQAWRHHLDDEGLVVLIEPATKAQSRRLLELRKALLPRLEKAGMQVLLPCLGHQACGALAAPEDWCHEDVVWWRPKYIRKIDELARLDRKSLPFSYLVLVKSKKPMTELLPGLADTQSRYRLVSPSYDSSPRESEAYICGEDGKFRARFPSKNETERGSILVDPEWTTREGAIQRIRKIKSVK